MSEEYWLQLPKCEKCQAPASAIMERIIVMADIYEDEDTPGRFIYDVLPSSISPNDWKDSKPCNDDGTYDPDNAWLMVKCHNKHYWETLDYNHKSIKEAIKSWEFIFKYTGFLIEMDSQGFLVTSPDTPETFRLINPIYFLGLYRKHVEVFGVNKVTTIQLLKQIEEQG